MEFEVQELSTEENEELIKYMGSDLKLRRLGSKGYFLNEGFEKFVSVIYNMPLKSSDTFVITFPKAGTTWAQELVWLLQNNVDFETAKITPLSNRFPFIESGSLLELNFLEENIQLYRDIEKKTGETIFADLEAVIAMPSPRFIKSHLPLSFLPPSLLETTKVVYVARDPRDVAVSYFYHTKSFHQITKDKEFKGYWNIFMRDMVVYAPFFEHLKEAWLQRNHPNMAFIFYEELSKDLPGVARRLAKFFGKEYTEEQIEALSDHLKFDNFKNNKSVNLEPLRNAGFITGPFVRKGKAGGWREHFDEEMAQQAERWIADNLRGTDLQFPSTN